MLVNVSRMAIDRAPIRRSPNRMAHTKLSASDLVVLGSRRSRPSSKARQVDELRKPGVSVLKGIRAYGRGEFFDREPYKGRTILVPFSMQSISPDSSLFSTGIPGRVFLVL
jgi:hypothetical protein